MTPDVSAVIVTWNSRDIVLRCLESLAESTDAALEVIVVDNASTDGTAEAISNRPADVRPVRLVRNPTNAGFPKAVNQGLQMASGPYVLLLNPDVLVGPGSVDAMLRILKADPEVGATGPRVRTPEGRVQLQCARRLPSLLDYVAGRFGLSGLLPHLRLPNRLMTDWDHADSREVECLSGACILLRTADLRKLGGLVEEMYLEDVELCWGVREKLRKRVQYVAEAEAVHHHSVSFHAITDRSQYLWIAEMVESSSLKHFALHSGSVVVAIARATNVISGLAKLLALSLVTPFLLHRGLRDRISKAIYRSYVRLMVGLRGPRFGTTLGRGLARRA